MPESWIVAVIVCLPWLAALGAFILADEGRLAAAGSVFLMGALFGAAPWLLGYLVLVDGLGWNPTVSAAAAIVPPSLLVRRFLRDMDAGRR